MARGVLVVLSSVDRMKRESNYKDERTHLGNGSHLLATKNVLRYLGDQYHTDKRWQPSEKHDSPV